MHFFERADRIENSRETVIVKVFFLVHLLPKRIRFGSGGKMHFCRRNNDCLFQKIILLKLLSTLKVEERSNNFGPLVQKNVFFWQNH